MPLYYSLKSLYYLSRPFTNHSKSSTIHQTPLLLIKSLYYPSNPVYYLSNMPIIHLSPPTSHSNPYTMNSSPLHSSSNLGNHSSYSTIHLAPSLFIMLSTIHTSPSTVHSSPSTKHSSTSTVYPFSCEECKKKSWLIYEYHIPQKRHKKPKDLTHKMYRILSLPPRSPHQQVSSIIRVV